MGDSEIAPPCFPIRAIRDIRGKANHFDHEQEHEQEDDYEERGRPLLVIRRNMPSIRQCLMSELVNLEERDPT